MPPEKIKRRVTVDLETRAMIEDTKTSGNPKYPWRRPLPGGKRDIETTFYFEPKVGATHLHQALTCGRARPARQYTRELC